jgi:hypothetical protein
MFRRGILAMLLIPLALSAQDSISDEEKPVIPDTAASATPLAGDPGSSLDKRNFGVFPNYRTADGDLPFKPITTGQKFTIARRDSLDYPSYALAMLFSGISQANNSNQSFGQGIEGYSRRYASAISDQVLGNFMAEAVFPSLLHQDPRYFRKGHGSTSGRIVYAASRVLVSKTDSGHWSFNASEVLGNGTVAAIGNLYYPDARSFGGTMQRMGTQIATDAISNLLKEFWPDVKRRLQKKQ